MSNRQEELALKRQRLAELRKQREERKGITKNPPEVLFYILFFLES